MKYSSEVRNSVIQILLEKVKKQNFKTYLSSIRLERIRLFTGSQINFEFPVTALIGPNGSGKSTILNSAMCAYSNEPSKFFQKTQIADDSMDNWQIEFEIIDKQKNQKGTNRSILSLKNDIWKLSENFYRPIKLFGLNRTVPPAENNLFALKKRIRSKSNQKLITKKLDIIDSIKRETEKILGKQMDNFELYEVSHVKKYIVNKRKKKEVPPITKTLTVKQLVFVGGQGNVKYSEFSFGAGESSIIRIVSEIETLPEQSLVLIEEIENGLHPLALMRLIDYLIVTAHKKGIQVIFTTHSDYATLNLPSEAVWACIDGRVEQGKLSVEVLRAVSGRIDKKLAIFVEDEFSKVWLEAIVREKLLSNFPEIGIYDMQGDGLAIKTHLSHKINPSISSSSICYLDGDSAYSEDLEKGIYKLPGSMPELTVFESIISNLEKYLALLTVAFQLSPEKQSQVKKEIELVLKTNRDSHLIYNQIGISLGLISEDTIRGAFISIWIQENSDEVNIIAENIKSALSKTDL